VSLITKVLLRLLDVINIANFWRIEVIFPTKDRWLDTLVAPSSGKWSCCNILFSFETYFRDIFSREENLVIALNRSRTHLTSSGSSLEERERESSVVHRKSAAKREMPTFIIALRWPNDSVVIYSNDITTVTRAFPESKDEAQRERGIHRVSRITARFR